MPQTNQSQTPEKIHLGINKGSRILTFAAIVALALSVNHSIKSTSASSSSNISTLPNRTVNSSSSTLCTVTLRQFLVMEENTVILSFDLFSCAERVMSSDPRENNASKTSRSHSASVPSKLPDLPDKTSFLETTINMIVHNVGRRERRQRLEALKRQGQGKGNRREAE
jgi:hypothetical protein